MTDVTAQLLVRVRVNRPGEPERWVVGAISKDDPAIAAALAEEREKARAPFRKLVEFYDRHEYSSINVDDLREILESA